jgi:hypothetical protein
MIRRCRHSSTSWASCSTRRVADFDRDGWRSAEDVDAEMAALIDAARQRATPPAILSKRVHQGLARAAK